MVLGPGSRLVGSLVVLSASVNDIAAPFEMSESRSVQAAGSPTGRFQRSAQLWNTTSSCNELGQSSQA
jgi:hypothetical protein